MRVGAAAQLRRKPPARARSSSAGTWVTDRMLSRAIERYIRCSVASSRHLSSHAGPLESRRRLGKRHMTDILPSSHPHRPLWHFEVLADRNTWLWEPPTSSGYRSEKNRKPSVARLFNQLIEWLEDSDAGKPFIEPPKDADTVAQPAEASPTDHTLETAAGEAIATRTLNHEILAFRANVSSIGQVEDETLYDLSRACVALLDSRIMKGELTAQELAFAMNPLDKGIEDQISSVGASKAVYMIRRGILSSLARAHGRNPAVASRDLWMALAQEICTMATTRDRNKIRLFRCLMEEMPPMFRDQIPDGQLLAITCSFVSLQGNKWTRSHTPSWVRISAMFNNGLALLNSGQQERLFRNIDSIVEQSADQHTQLTWLLSRAFTSQLDRAVFIRNFDKLQRTTMGAPKLHVWQLVAARLVSSRFLAKEEYMSLLAQRGGTASLGQAWVSLILAVSRAPQGNAGLQELCLCLDDMGRFQQMAHALALGPYSSPDWLEAVHALVAACDDHRLAVKLYTIVRSKDKQYASRTIWQRETWSPYVERIIKDPQMAHTSIFKLVDFMSTPAAALGSREDDVRAKMELLGKMGQWYNEAKHLNDRQTLRRVEQCLLYQRRLAKRVSSQSVVNVMTTVIRDLERGNPGRPTRLEWLVNLVSKTEGQRTAARALAALKGWRWMTLERRKGR